VLGKFEENVQAKVQDGGGGPGVIGNTKGGSGQGVLGDTKGGNGTAGSKPKSNAGRRVIGNMTLWDMLFGIIITIFVLL
jgi:hypothetical protein